jgi:hypothetical protein
MYVCAYNIRTNSRQARMAYVLPDFAFTASINTRGKQPEQYYTTSPIEAQIDPIIENTITDGNQGISYIHTYIHIHTYTSHTHTYIYIYNIYLYTRYRLSYLAIPLVNFSGTIMPTVCSVHRYYCNALHR